jgi:hypothetical protein
MDEDFPVFRVDYPCICGHNDYKLFYGFIELTDPEDFITLFADYPKKKKPRVKEKHYPGLFGHLIPKKEWPKCPRE